VNADNSPGNQANGQRRHDVTGSSGLTRKPSLHNYYLTSSISDEQLIGGGPASTTLQSDTEVIDVTSGSAVAAGSVDKPARPATGRVAFASTLVTGEVASNSTSFNRYTSSLSGDSSVVGYSDVSYCPDDYDNTMGDDDRQQSETSRHPSTNLSEFSTDEQLGKTSSATATSAAIPRSTIKSSEEESLDKIVAHLLGEVSPVVTRRDAAQESTTSNEKPAAPSDSETSSSLRWPQGDSLPRVEARRTVTVGEYDVPVSRVDAGGKLASGELSADENDNVVKIVTLSHGVVDEPPASQASAPADLPHSPPLVTFRKRSTPTIDSGDDVTSSDKRPQTELVSKLNVEPGSEDVAKDERGHEYSVRFNCSLEQQLSSESDTTSRFNLTAQQLSQAEQLQNESRPTENESKVDEFRDVATSPEVSLSTGMQPTTLLDQFKVLRLEVLTSTSQLLSCVSGTWKRGETFRSKLTTIMQLCLALRTSVGKLETFLISALAAAAHCAAIDPLVDTANTRIKNLQAVQTSIDAYIETLDGENLSGTVDKRDLKVGGIIHLTKEIPGLVRTFAPVVEYLAAANDTATQSSSGTISHQFDVVSDKVEVVQPQNVVDVDRDGKTQNKINEQEEEAKWNFAQHNAAVYLITQTEHETYPDTQQTTVGNSTDTTDSVLQSAETHNDHGSDSTISDNVQLQTIPDTIRSDSTPAVSHKDAENTSSVSAGEPKDVDRTDEELEHEMQASLPPPVLPVKVETAAPPTPPPKLRVASRYHASLGITNSLTTVPSAAVTTEASERHDGNDIATRCDLATKSPAAEEHTAHEMVTTSDKFQLTDRRLDDCVGGSSEVPTTPDVGYATGCEEEIVAAAGKTHFRFPRAVDTGSSQQSDVALRKPEADWADLDVHSRHCHVSESELETPDFRASGVSQTMVDQLEALQRQANVQAIITHTDTAAGFDRFDAAVRSPNPHHQTTLSADDRRLMMFYCDQMTGHWTVLDNAASAFFHCMDRRQPPKVFVSHSKFVIVAGHKMAYLGDVLSRNIEDDNAQNWIVAYSNRLCTSLKAAVRATKEAALEYPAVPSQQMMVDCVKQVTDWALELKEVVDRLAYIGRPDHVLA